MEQVSHIAPLVLIIFILVLIITLIILRYSYFGNNVRYGPALLKNEVVRGYPLNQNCGALKSEEEIEDSFWMFQDLTDGFNKMESWLFRDSKEIQPPLGGLNLTKKLGVPFISNKDNSDLEFSLSF